MKTIWQRLDPRHWLGMATKKELDADWAPIRRTLLDRELAMATDKPIPGLFGPNTQMHGGLPAELREQRAREAARQMQNTPGVSIGTAAVFNQQYGQSQSYQQARANADYEAAMAARKREIHVKIVPGSNGWVVEMEGQDPWVCKDITELGETITSAIGVRVLEGGSK